MNFALVYSSPSAFRILRSRWIKTTEYYKRADVVLTFHDKRDAGVREPSA
jgi:hypothetical protein